MVRVRVTIPEKNPSKFFIKLGGLINRRNNTLKKIRFDKKYLYWLTNDPKRYFDKNMPADHNELLWHALVWKRQSLDFPFEKKKLDSIFYRDCYLYKLASEFRYISYSTTQLREIYKYSEKAIQQIELVEAALKKPNQGKRGLQSQKILGMSQFNMMTDKEILTGVQVGKKDLQLIRRLAHKDIESKLKPRLKDEKILSCLYLVWRTIQYLIKFEGGEQYILYGYRNKLIPDNQTILTWIKEFTKDVDLKIVTAAIRYLKEKRVIFKPVNFDELSLEELINLNYKYFSKKIKLPK